MMKLIALLFATVLCLTLPESGSSADKITPAAKPPEAAKAAPAEKKAETPAKQGPLDINTASEADLKALDGIGDTYSRKIIAGRPYTKKDQLLSKKIVPKEIYDRIKDKIITSQVKKQKEQKEQQNPGYP